MDSEVAAQFERLRREISDLRQRVARIEGTQLQALSVEAQPPAEARPTLSASRQLAFAGRTLIVLGGAYLLRALTDGGMLSPSLGASCGLVYAASLLALAHRAAPRDRGSATYHGLSGALIAYPLIWETSTRLGILQATSAATALTIFFGLGLLVAWHRTLPVVAWISLVFALATALVLLVGTGQIVPFAVALFVAAAICETLAFDVRWRSLRWPPALALDVVLLQLGFLLVRPDGLPDHYAAVSVGAGVALELALPVLYLGSIAARTIVRGRIITNFGIFQCTTALLIGLGSAAHLLVFHGTSLRWVGSAALVLGASAYAVAYVHAERRAERSRNFYFYVTLGGLLTLAGFGLLLDGISSATAWSALAIAAAWIGARHQRKTLRFHAAAYLFAAAATSGLLRHLISASAVLVAVAMLASYVISAKLRRNDEWKERIPDVFSAAMLVWAVIGIAAHGMSLWIGDDAFMTSARTGVIATTAVAVAWLAAHHGLRELGWLVYPILVAGGLKLLVEDFRVGRPASLFLSLALYGAALILAPRFLRK